MGKDASTWKKLQKFWRKFRNFAFLVGGLGLVAVVWHYWFSIKVTFDLKYPENPRVLVLAKQQDVAVVRGAFDEKYGRGLGVGEYREVLTNKHGSFYLAPALGFFVQEGKRRGFGVGGVYISNEDPDKVYLWDYLLKNENRSYGNSSTSRTLSMTEDQPERVMFLDSDWYEEKGWDLLGRPMIDEDFTLNRSLFRTGE